MRHTVRRFAGLLRSKRPRDLRGLDLPRLREYGQQHDPPCRCKPVRHPGL